MNTIDTQKIADFLSTHHLVSGLGTAEEPCSVAAINLALTGRLTDDIPQCMSPVIGKWIIGVQDAMPDAMRNSAEWKALLPLAAGTGRDPALEQRRAALLLDWMWSDVLPELQPIADAGGFGAAWRTMLTDRTSRAAWAAAREAAEAAAAADAAAADAAAEAARAGAESAAWAAWAADAAWATADAAAADASAAAADASAARAAARAAEANFWARVGPVETLRGLVDVRGGEA